MSGPKTRERRARAARPIKSEAAGWAAATTLADLGALTAEWIAESRDWHPTYRGVLDPESFQEPQIVPALLAANRAGWLTDMSQPGLIDRRARQRAMIAGFVTHDMARYAQHLAISSDLIVIDTYKAVRSIDHDDSDREDYVDQVSIAITSHGPTPYTWAGRTESAQDLWRCFGPVSRDSWPALVTAVGLQVLDPVWGRNSALWPWVHQFADAIGAGDHERWCEHNPLGEDGIPTSLCMWHA